MSNIFVWGGGVPGSPAGAPSFISGTAVLRLTANVQVFTVSAVIPIYDVNMNIVGYGPSFSPQGVFYGRTDLQNGDKWNCFGGVTFTATPQIGGTYQLDGISGTWTMGWQLFHVGTGLVETGSKSVVIP